jgi:hypothetical protein
MHFGQHQREEPIMGKPDESRRAFLVGAAVGASAVAGTTMVTGALAQHRQHTKTTEVPDGSHGPSFATAL